MIAILPDSLSVAVKTKESDFVVRPSWLSPATSMNVRYAIDSRDDDEVLAVRISDAMAAISARSIAKRKPRICVRVLPNSAPPKGIPADVRQGVDTWLFPSARMRELYPSDLNDARVEPEVDTDFDGTPDYDSAAGNYVWIGEINDNTERLKKAINWVNSLPQGASLTIFGEGKARNVMPAVKLARSIEHPERIVWTGCPLVSGQQIEKPISGVLQAGLDPTPLELRFKQNGLPLIDDYAQP